MNQSKMTWVTVREYTYFFAFFKQTASEIDLNKIKKYKLH